DKFDQPEIRACPLVIVDSAAAAFFLKIAAFESVQDKQTAVGLVNKRLGVVRKVAEAETGAFELLGKEDPAVARVDDGALCAISAAAPCSQDEMSGKIHAFLRGV